LMKSAALLFALLFMALPVCQAQSEGEVSLGDVARSYRKDKKAPKNTIIDNENLTQVMDEIQSRKFGVSLLFSFDDGAKNFQVSSPDGTWSLSFDGRAAALLSDPYVARDLPGDEVVKLQGPAEIDGRTLQVSVYNGSTWSLRELTVGLTLVRRAP